MKKGFVFAVHSVLGLLSGLFILVMSLSGAALVFHQELDSLQYPQVSAVQNNALLPIDSMYYKLQRKFPHAQVSNCGIAENNTSPFIFSVYDSSYQNGTAAMQVFMHPQTGEVLKARGGSNDVKNNFISWLAGLHSSFHLGKTGEWLLGFFAVIFLLSLVTGVVLYRKNILSVLLFKKQMFAKASLHQLIGVYALLFNLMIATTGAWMQRYVFTKDFYEDYSYTPVLKPSPPLFFSVDTAFKNMHTMYPDFTVGVIYFAQNTQGKTAVYGSQSTNSFIHSKKYADVIMLDSAGKIVKTAFVGDIDADSRYDIVNAQIHYGQYGGLPVKIVYSLFGLSGGLLSITGFLLWVKRRKGLV